MEKVLYSSQYSSLYEQMSKFDLRPLGIVM